MAKAEADRVIAPQEKARLARALDEREEKERRKAEQIARVTELLAGGEKPDPADPADRAVVEAHFESIAGAFAELPPEDRATAEDLYVAQTGVLPTAIKNALLGGLLSSDPAAQVAAAQRLVKLEGTDAARTEGIPEALRALARAIREDEIETVNDKMVDNRLDLMRELPNFKDNPGWVPRAESFRIGPKKQ